VEILPAHNEPAEHVDDEGHVDPAGKRLYVSQVGDPQAVRRRGHELAIDEVTRSVLVLVVVRSDLELTSPPGAAGPLGLHQSPHGAVRDFNLLEFHLFPDLLRAVDSVAVALVNEENLGFK
jgi:hypothetical protein